MRKNLSCKMLFSITIDNFKYQFQYNNNNIHPDGEPTVCDDLESKSRRSINNSDLSIYLESESIFSTLWEWYWVYSCFNFNSLIKYYQPNFYHSLINHQKIYFYYVYTNVL